MWRRLWEEQEGVATVEYALLLALVVVVGMAAWYSLGQKIQQALEDTVNAFDEAGIGS